MKLVKDINLRKVPESEKQTLANLMQLYLYDTSEFNADEIDADGLLDVGSYFDAYWVESVRHPYFIELRGHLVGFALVREFEPGKFSIAEFFVTRKYRRSGVGKTAACQLFDTFDGEWHVAQEAGNHPAHRFWVQIISEYTGGNFRQGASESQPTGPKQIFRSLDKV